MFYYFKKRYILLINLRKQHLLHLRNVYFCYNFLKFLIFLFSILIYTFNALTACCFNPLVRRFLSTMQSSNGTEMYIHVCKKPNDLETTQWCLVPQKRKFLGSYCLLVPLMHQEQEGTMYEEQNIDKTEQLVGIPKCIEPCKSIEWTGKLQRIASELISR